MCDGREQSERPEFEHWRCGLETGGMLPIPREPPPPMAISGGNPFLIFATGKWLNTPGMLLEDIRQ